MNVYIMVDSEGVSGLYDRQQNAPGRLYSEDSRNFMTRDVNICAEACKAAGVEKVYVRDAHDDGSYIRWEELSPAVDYIVKGGAAYRVRHAGIEDCDAVILLGYHAMTGTEGAILAHTMDGGHHYYVNDVEYGEIAIDAALCGKPVILVTGDDYACAEAKRFLPWVTTCEVKKGLAFDKAMLLAPDKAHALIRKKTMEAIADLKNKQVYEQSKPVTLLCTAPDRKPRRGEGEDLTHAALARVEVDE